MPGWVSELLKLIGGAALGITVFTIVADNINVGGGVAGEVTEEATTKMRGK